MNNDRSLARIIDAMDDLTIAQQQAKQNRRGSRDPLKNIQDIKRQRDEQRRQEAASRLSETL